MSINPSCRSCGTSLEMDFVDLGLSPVSNALVKPEMAGSAELFLPLRTRVCTGCWLVQLADLTGTDLHFHDDYVYFSSYSTSWLAHSQQYVEKVCSRFQLDSSSRVMEVASNDGYLLQYFVKAGVPCLGIEPTANTAMAARERGVDTRELFFGRQTAKNLADEGWRVDLLLGNNVLAHVPDINDFVGGMPLVLKPEGVITLEFPHLLRLIQNNQFDTIYHEHYSYLSLLALQPVFERAGLRIFDIDQLQTHGGSLRIYACLNSAAHEGTEALQKSLDEELSAGMNSHRFYADFSDRVRSTKRALLLHLIESKEAGRQIVGYGAAAKGNTLLNYCGIGADFIDYVVDRNPAKQNRLLPGTRIPVFSPDRIFDTKPDEVLILPWNIASEVMQQMSGIREWGGRFVIPIPRVHLA